MKIEIITLLNVTNYGSLLQSYATQVILESFGHEVEFIDYVRSVDTVRPTLRKCIHSPTLMGLAKGLYQYLYYKPLQRRRSNMVFEWFLKNNLHRTERRFFSFEELCRETPKADVYCTGSDQMWNSKWNQGIEKAFFLDFVKNAPRISFSTSIGVTEFPSDEEAETVRLIREYDFLTMREQSAVQLLARYGIESQAVLDPTLMCDSEFWKDFCKKESERFCSQKYILVYKLHTDHKNVDFERYVRFIMEKTGLPVKVIAYGVPIKKRYSSYVFLPTIREFVALFANAEYVVTDSFHATCFSLIFEKALSVICPSHFSTRLENILKICSMTDHIICNDEYTELPSTANYTEIREILGQERAKTLRIIKKGIDDCVVNS